MVKVRVLSQRRRCSRVHRNNGLKGFGLQRRILGANVFQASFSKDPLLFATSQLSFKIRKTRICVAMRMRSSFLVAENLFLFSTRLLH